MLRSVFIISARRSSMNSNTMARVSSVDAQACGVQDGLYRSTKEREGEEAALSASFRGKPASFALEESMKSGL